jgi:hypothetical protein
MAEAFESNEKEISLEFPGPITLPPRGKWWWGCLIGGRFIIPGIFALYLPDDSTELTLAIVAMAFGGVAFFATGAILFLRPGFYDPARVCGSMKPALKLSVPLVAKYFAGAK